MQSFGWQWASHGARISLCVSKSRDLPYSTGTARVCSGATYLCVGQCDALPSACTSRGEDEITTLGQALMQRIQWPRYRILIPPRTRHPNSIAVSGSRGTTSDAGTGAQRQQKQAQQQQEDSITRRRQQQQQQQEQEINKTKQQQQQKQQEEEPGNLRLNSSHNYSRRRSPGNHRLSSSHRRSRPGNLCLKTRLFPLFGQMLIQTTSLLCL